MYIVVYQLNYEQCESVLSVSEYRSRYNRFTFIPRYLY